MRIFAINRKRVKKNSQENKSENSITWVEYKRQWFEENNNNFKCK